LRLMIRLKNFLLVAVSEYRLFKNDFILLGIGL